VSKIRVLIFDWDGTLMDSADQIVHCMQMAADDCKVPPPTKAAVESIIGLGLPEALAILFPELNDTRRHLVRTRYAWHFVAGTGGESRMFPGAKDMLHALKAKGYRMTVATGKSRMGLDRVLVKTGLQDFFHATRCADETISKPDPLMLHQILQKFKAQPENALMIGDTTYDMEMAQRIDMPRVGVTYGVHNDADLLLFEPLQLFDDVETLAAYLRSL
jgi:phosphoglycolate phosphatase